MSTALVPITAAPLTAVAQAADTAAARSVFADYRRRRAAHTLRRQDADLDLFARFLWSAGVAVEQLASNPAAWCGVSWGLVAGFVQWQLQQGYAIGSVNVRLATVKSYAKLAMQAGAITPAEYALIKTVGGYRQREARNVDAERVQTRVGAKKAAAVSISLAQAMLLKSQDDPADALLMCLLLDHGLRCGEVAALTVEGFDIQRGTFTFYRQKVDKTQTHTMTVDTLRAALRYLPGLEAGRLFSMSERTINRRVGALGAAVGIARLSPHDLRHYWATAAVRGGTDIKSLQDAGGWSSPAMPLRYAESTVIANTGVKLG